MTSPWYIAGAGSIGLLLFQQLKQQLPCYLINRNLDAGPSEISFTNVSHQTSQLALHWFTPKKPEPCISKLIITTKSHQVETCLEGLIPYLCDQASIVLLHNGLGVQQQAIKRWPEYQFFLASTTSGAWKTEDSLTHAGQGQTHIGHVESAMPPSSTLQELCTYLPDAHWSNDIMTALHLKVAINAAINPLTALYECRNGELLDNSIREQQLMALAQETQAVFKDVNIAINDVEDTVRNVAHNTALNFSSTYQDWKHHRKTELIHMNGYIQQLAQDAGLKVPEHDKVMAILKDKVQL